MKMNDNHIRKICRTLLWYSKLFLFIFQHEDELPQKMNVLRDMESNFQCEILQHILNVVN